MLPAFAARFRGAFGIVGEVAAAFMTALAGNFTPLFLVHGSEAAVGRVDTLQESLVVLEPDLTVRSANRSFYETFKLQRAEVERHKLFDLGRGEWDIPELRGLLSADLPLESLMHRVVIGQHFRDLGRRVLSINVRSLEEGRLSCW